MFDKPFKQALQSDEGYSKIKHNITFQLKKFCRVNGIETPKNEILEEIIQLIFVYNKGLSLYQFVHALELFSCQRFDTILNYELYYRKLDIGLVSKIIKAYTLSKNKDFTESIFYQQNMIVVKNDKL